jgi:hypothetical protein
MTPTPEQEKTIEKTYLGEIDKYSGFAYDTTSTLYITKANASDILIAALAAERERLAGKIEAMRQPTGWTGDPDDYKGERYNEAVRDILQILNINQEPDKT